MRPLLICLLACMPLIGMHAENRALLIGIGRYPVHTGWTEIHGDADVNLLASRLAENGFTDVRTLQNAQSTKAAIVEELKALASRCNSGDKVYFHFSGHGQPVADINGDEGAKGFDEAIVPYDACKTITSIANGRFYNGENHLIDDELNPLFAEIKKKLGCDGELFIAIDACYSDDMERAPGSEESELPPARGTNDRLNVKNAEPWKSIPRPKEYTAGAKMYVVSACKSDERNFEYKANNGKTYGSLSYYIYYLMESTMDFNAWSKSIVSKNIVNPKIFHNQQHPQSRMYD